MVQDGIKSKSDGDLQLESTSNKTSKIMPTIVIRENSQYRITMDPSVINNTKDPDCYIEGKIVVEKKSVSDDWTDEKLKISDLRVGQYTEINFKSDDIHKLYVGLKKLFDSFSSKDGGENCCYMKFDGTPESIQKFIFSDYFWSFHNKDDGKELVKRFSEIICDEKNDKNDYLQVLVAMEHGSEEAVKRTISLLSKPEYLEEIAKLDDKSISEIRGILDLSLLKKAKTTIESHLHCKDEKKWQEYFEEQSWILEQLFLTPYQFFGRELNTGVPDIRGRNSNTIDFGFIGMYSNELAVVEIKPPTAQLVCEAYRNNVFEIGKEVTNGIGQVLQNKDNLMKYYNSKQSNSDPSDRYSLFDPECILLIGDYSIIEDDENKKRSFELFRKNSKNVRIVTYNEILSRITNLISLMSSPQDK